MDSNKYIVASILVFMKVGAEAQVPPLDTSGMDYQMMPSAPSTLRPIIDPVSHRMRLGVRIVPGADGQRMGRAASTSNLADIASGSGGSMVGDQLPSASGQLFGRPTVTKKTFASNRLNMDFSQTPVAQGDSLSQQVSVSGDTQ